MISDGPPPMYVSEPWTYAFSWLSLPFKSPRSSILLEDAWSSSIDRFQGELRRANIAGKECAIATFKSVRSGDFYEVAFAESLGYLPVRVCRFTSGHDDPTTVTSIGDFQSFDFDGKSVWYPCLLERTEKGLDGVSAKLNFTTTIDMESLLVNQSVDQRLFDISNVSAR